MAKLTWVIFCVVIPYLLGSINFGIIFSKLIYHADVRKSGSGNAGMTNMLRTFGKGAGALTFVCDFGKGIAAVLLAKWWLGSMPEYESWYWLALGVSAAVLFAMLGHMYPVYFKFKGGKGVAVAAGCIIAANPIIFVAIIAVFGIVFLCSKMVSLASISAAVAYAFSTAVYYLCFAGVHGAGALGRSDAAVMIAGSVLASALVIWKHRSNIQRIANGTEYRFGQKKDKSAKY